MTPSHTRLLKYTAIARRREYMIRNIVKNAQNLKCCKLCISNMNEILPTFHGTVLAYDRLAPSHDRTNLVDSLFMELRKERQKENRETNVTRKEMHALKETNVNMRNKTRKIRTRRTVRKKRKTRTNRKNT